MAPLLGHQVGLQGVWSMAPLLSPLGSGRSAGGVVNGSSVGSIR